MLDAPVDEVNFFDPFFDGADGGIDLGDHPSGDDAFLDQSLDPFDGQGGDERVVLLGIAHDAGHVAEIDHLGRAERRCDGSRRRVCVDVVDGSVFVASDGRDNGDDFGSHGFLDCSDVDADDFPDEAQVDFLALFIALGGELFDLEYLVAGDADGLASKLVDRLDDLGVDVVGEHVLDDTDGRFAGNAQAVDKPRLDARLAHLRGDRLAAAVDQDRVDADRFQEHDVAQQPVDGVFIFHRAAAVFDDEKLAAIFLHERERLNEGFRADEMRGLGHYRIFELAFGIGKNDDWNGPTPFAQSKNHSPMLNST